MLRSTLSLMLFALIQISAYAQTDFGVLTGGIESNSVLYRDMTFRSNNYLKLDWKFKGFSAGIQAEYYPNPLLGYDINLKGIGLPGKYVAWNSRSWSLTAGDYYEQFGTGIILRSWEDRNLGWNNSLGGARVAYKTPDGVFSFKAFGGAPRQYLRYSSNRLSGLETNLRLGYFALAASTVMRYDDKANWAYSILPSFESEHLSARAEWVGRCGGNAQTVEVNCSIRGFSGALTLRRLDKMLDNMGMNYLPALCQEQYYMLATLNPYTTFAAGEAGGNADLFYKYKSWKFHINGSLIYALPSALKNHDECRMAYRDINLQVERRWSRRLKTVAFVSIQENSPTHGERNATDVQNVFVMDGVYKFSGAMALRLQAQYLYSQELTKDWVAALAELSSTSGWSFHLQDMYNHGSSRQHFYEAGASWSRDSFTVTLSYGHQRAGLVCSGGVCRWQPEYTGGMLRLNYNF